jgi:diguanylate cyclase (GGDEF)-like protein/PAS domain S-box-containing protein
MLMPLQTGNASGEDRQGAVDSLSPQVTPPTLLPAAEPSAEFRAPDIEPVAVMHDPELDTLARCVAQALDVPLCLVLLCEGRTHEVGAAVGLVQGELRRMAGFAKQVAASRAVAVALDVRHDARMVECLPLAGDADGTVAFMAAQPVLVGTRLVGVMCVADRVPHAAFGEKQRELLAGFCELMAQSIDHHEQRVHVARERVLFEEGPVAAVVWGVRDGLPVESYVSPNIGNVMAPVDHARVVSGESFEILIWHEDRKLVRVALQSHVRSRLPYLETVFRIGAEKQWVQLVTYGDYDAQGHLLDIRGYLSNINRQKQLEAAVEATRERLFLALESAQIGTWDLNLKTQARVVNPRTAAMLGYRADELDLNNAVWNNLVHPYDRVRLSEAVEHRLAMTDAEIDQHPEVFSIEYRVRHKHGHYIWVQSCGKLVSRDEFGAPERLVGTLMDVTERKSMELQRLQQQRLLDLVNTAQRTFLLDKSLVTACDALFEPLLRLTESHFGFIGIVRKTEEGATYLNVPTISNISWDEASRDWYQKHKESQGGINFHALDNLFGHVVTHNTIVCTNDPSRHSASRGTPHGHPQVESFLGIPLRYNNQAVGMIALGNRIEGYGQELIDLLEPLTTALGTLVHARELEEKRLEVEDQLLNQATHDSLTGLSNRRRFFDVAERLIAQAKRRDHAFTIALADLDLFKRINDTHGHAAGDAVLRGFAEVLLSLSRETDLVARVGGEEFAILLDESTIESAITPLTRIREAAERMMVRVDGELIQVTVSMGASQWQGPDDTVDACLARADAALYKAKERGRNNLVLG